MNTKIFNDLSNLYPLWRKALLGKSDHELIEIEFIKDLLMGFNGQVQTVIDLGGGVGTHAVPLQRAGYGLTLFDCSREALAIAKIKEPELNIVRDSFESINLSSNYHAAICMWSTLSYISTEKGRQHFYEWVSSHVEHCLIFDQPNFSRYPISSSKRHLFEDANHHLGVLREWTFDPEHGIKKTNYRYKIHAKKTSTKTMIYDQEEQHYVELPKLHKYLGAKWKIQQIYGNYSLSDKFNPATSERMIAVYARK